MSHPSAAPRESRRLGAIPPEWMSFGAESCSICVPAGMDPWLSHTLNAAHGAKRLKHEEFEKQNFDFDGGLGRSGRMG